jgi:hypothetical protein
MAVNTEKSWCENMLISYEHDLRAVRTRALAQDSAELFDDPCSSLMDVDGARRIGENLPAEFTRGVALVSVLAFTFSPLVTTATVDLHRELLTRPCEVESPQPIVVELEADLWWIARCEHVVSQQLLWF